MADSVGVRKIKAALVKNMKLDDYVSEDGYVYYDVQTGEARLANGQPGGIPIWGGGAGAGTGSVSMVSLIDMDTEIIQATYGNPYRLSLDENTFTIDEYQAGNLKISAVSQSFAEVNVDNDGALAVIRSVDSPTRNLDLIAGPGIELKAKVENNSQSIRIENTAPTSTFGFIIGTYIDAAGDLIFDHADAFDPSLVYINDDSYLIISTSPFPESNTTYGITLPTGSGSGSGSTAPAGVTVASPAPASPVEGQLWMDSNTGKLYVYTQNQWVQPT